MNSTDKVLLLHVFAQHSNAHISKTMSAIGAHKVFLLDFTPSIHHPYIRLVLETTKKRFKDKIVRPRQLRALTRKY